MTARSDAKTELNKAVGDAAKDILDNSLKKVTEFLGSYVTQPDRVAVILATAKADSLLQQAIMLRLLPCPSSVDDLLESDRGVGTLSIRISLAHRLGLIDASLARALTLLRRIRNDCAHSFDDESLDKSPHRDRIAELASPIMTSPVMRGLREKCARDLPTLSQTKLHYCVVSAMILSKLELVVALTTRVDAKCAAFAKY